MHLLILIWQVGFCKTLSRAKVMPVMLVYRLFTPELVEGAMDLNFSRFGSEMLV